MPTPASGTISVSDINIELGNASNAPGGLGDSRFRGLARIDSGAISLNNFYNKSC